MDEAIKPQPGPQTVFLSTSADFALYGGAAFGGKTFALLLEPTRHIHIPGFGAVIFRRELVQVKKEGGLFDESMLLYPSLGGVPNSSGPFWMFPSGAAISFGHLENETTVLDWQGSQIAFLAFDELTHFSKRQVFYMLSRNRSTCGVRPYVRATTNPDKNSWVRKFIDWWIYPKSHPLAGFADPTRSGVVRWFIQRDDKIIWRDNKEDFDPNDMPLSFTFVAAKSIDNKIGLDRDPSYMARLSNLSKIDRARLMDGNWDADEQAGEIFNRTWFRTIPVAPGKLKKVIRMWDRAATVPSARNPEPDYTAGVKLGLTQDERFVVLDVVRFHGTPAAVEARIKNVASQDGPSVEIGITQDPGQAGVMEAQYLAKKLAGYTVRLLSERGDKVTRAKPFSSQAEVGNVALVSATWNDDYLEELHSFPDGDKADQVDASSGAFTLLTDASAGTFTDGMTGSDSGMGGQGLRW